MIPRHSQRATAEAPEDIEIRKDMAIHDVMEAICRLYENLDAQSAHWVATWAIILADRKAHQS